MCNVVAVLCSSDFAILLSRQQRVATPPSLAISSLLPPPPLHRLILSLYFPSFPIRTSRVPPFFTRFRPSFPTRSVTPGIPRAALPLHPFSRMPQIYRSTRVWKRKKKRSSSLLLLETDNLFVRYFSRVKKDSTIKNLQFFRKRADHY